MTETRKEVAALWIQEKNGNRWLKGKNVIGFFSKSENPKAPKIKCYKANDDGKAEKECWFSLWEQTGKSGNKYLTGYIEGGAVEQKVYAFENNEEGSKKPNLVVYAD